MPVVSNQPGRLAKSRRKRKVVLWTVCFPIIILCVPFLGEFMDKLDLPRAAKKWFLCVGIVLVAIIGIIPWAIYEGRNPRPFFITGQKNDRYLTYYFLDEVFAHAFAAANMAPVKRFGDKSG
ncbi:MAG: hypothetical protein ACI8UO_005133 [Verrucomicrobiales bacterium]